MLSVTLPAAKIQAPSDNQPSANSGADETVTKSPANDT